jgi:hypothetical protein
MDLTARYAQQESLSKHLPLVHGVFWLAGGLWAVLHRRSFEKASGPKVDYWLVRTVGSLLAVSGLSLVSAWRADRVTRETAMTAAGGAAALVAIDVVYVARRRISPVYLLDGLAHLLLAAAWLPRLGLRVRR